MHSLNFGHFFDTLVLLNVSCDFHYEPAISTILNGPGHWLCLDVWPELCTKCVMVLLLGMSTECLAVFLEALALSVLGLVSLEH